LRNTNATNLELRNFKYGIINLFTGFLLLLKERLRQHNPELIYKGNPSDIKIKIESGNKNLRTVNYPESISRLKKGPQVTFKKSDAEIIEKIRNLRNEFVHFNVSADKYQLSAETQNFIDIIENFIQNELGLDPATYSIESKQVHLKAEEMRERIIDFESNFEYEVYKILSLLSGNEIPGDFLSSENDLLIPNEFIKERVYFLDSNIYRADIVGVSLDGSELVIEVIGAYLPNGGIHILNRLEIFKENVSNSKVWLIVFGEVPDYLKDRAIKMNLLLTDIEGWKKIKDLVYKKIAGDKE